MLNNQVDNQGGMKQKYSEIINWLSTHQNAKISKIKRDYIEISCIMQTTATYFNILETFDGVEIEWIARLGMMGNHNLKWKFPSTTSEEEIIKKISFDLQEYENKMFDNK
jgi:hypothetical protein